MNGAESLLNTLVANKVEVCFTNPGTSEMHFVAALDRVPKMRGVLCLFEGVASGAADGYGRIAERPASTLLHLGPGMGNALANFHNARRAKTPIINVVGDHATTHLAYDAPLTSDIEGIAKSFSKFVVTPKTPNQVEPAVQLALQAATMDQRGIATVIVPADASWNELTPEKSMDFGRALWNKEVETIETIGFTEMKALLERGNETMLLLGGQALSAGGLRSISKILSLHNVSILAETFPSVLERGGDLLSIDRLAYLGEMAVSQLANASHVITIGANEPVSFFAYPNTPSQLAPANATVHHFIAPNENLLEKLDALCDYLGAKTPLAKVSYQTPELPDGDLTGTKAAQTIGALLREGTIVVDESNTSGLFLPSFTKGAPAHRWLTLTGGAIGQGLPLATGAAVADPNSRVLCLEADGSAIYTFQALWSQAREKLNVTTVLFNNQSYAILELELAKVGALESSPSARAMLELKPPSISFSELAQAMGVESLTVRTVSELAKALTHSFDRVGPFLIEAILPPGIS